MHFNIPSSWFLLNAIRMIQPPTRNTRNSKCTHRNLQNFFLLMPTLLVWQSEILHWITSSPKCDLVSLTNTSSLSHKWNSGRLKSNTLPDLSIPWRQSSICMPTSPASFSFSHFSSAPWRISIHMHSVSPVCCSTYSQILAFNVTSISAFTYKIIFMLSVFSPWHNKWLHVWKNNNV